MENIEIFLSEDERRYLLLTGKNGSGKTSLPETLSRYLRQVANARNFLAPHGKKQIEQNWLLKGTLNDYNFEGIVLIDEIETHLHIELQRK